jgi:class 3 adenylate cyclase
MTGGDPNTVEATFVFADIAGFTALTEAYGDHDAAALVTKFCRSVRAELPASGGSEVKAIGDAVMLSIPDPAEAILLGLRVAHELMRGHGAPAVRVGLHHGPAIEREGRLLRRGGQSGRACPARRVGARCCSPVRRRARAGARGSAL